MMTSEATDVRRELTYTSCCMVCGSTDILTRYEVSDKNQGVPGRWHILSCERCGLGVLAPFPSPNEIESFYRDEFYTEEGKRFRGPVEFARRALAKLRGRSLNRMAPPGKLLDFGSGSGHFAAAQSEAGWQVLALDPYSGSAGEGRHVQLQGDSFRLNFADETFDAVTLWYVIEHLANPRAAIAEFRRVLKQDGILVLAQQDFASIQARVFGPRWLFLDPPRHLWQFSPANLGQLVEQEGFTTCAVERASIEMGPFTILQSALNSIVGNENDLFRFLKNRKLRLRDSSLDGKAVARLAASLVLLPVALPAALVAYYVLLLARSSDVFTLYCRRT